MPNISGFGNVCSLQEAMAQDESGELKALIEQYMTETNAAVRKGMIDKIISTGQEFKILIHLAVNQVISPMIIIHLKMPVT